MPRSESKHESSSDAPRRRTAPRVDFSGLLVLFKIGWAIACCVLFVMAIVGLLLIDDGQRWQWWGLLAGSIAALPAGWWFLSFVQGRLRALAEGESDASKRRSALFDRVFLFLFGLILLSAGAVCVMTQHVYTDDGWTKIPAWNAWLLGGLSIFFGVICLLALFGRGEDPEEGA